MIANVNWTAVLVGFFAAYALGFLWYGILFRKSWAAGHGLAAPPERLPLAAMLLQAAGTFLLALLVGMAEAAGQLLEAVLIVLCIMAFLGAGALFTMRSGTVVAIETGYILSMGIVLLLVQAIL